jgi:hypothetical protein
MDANEDFEVGSLTTAGLFGLYIRKGITAGRSRDRSFEVRVRRLSYQLPFPDIL